MASQTSTKKYLAIGGMVAVIGVVGMIALDYPPAGDDAAGTIVPAKRFRADGGGTTIIGDSTATQAGTSVANGANAGATLRNAASAAKLRAPANAAQQRRRTARRTPPRQQRCECCQRRNNAAERRRGQRRGQAAADAASNAARTRPPASRRRTTLRTPRNAAESAAGAATRAERPPTLQVRR